MYRTAPRLLQEASDPPGHWITIRGTHVFLPDDRSLPVSPAWVGRKIGRIKHRADPARSKALFAAKAADRQASAYSRRLKPATTREDALRRSTRAVERLSSRLRDPGPDALSTPEFQRHINTAAQVLALHPQTLQNTADPRRTSKKNASEARRRILAISLLKKHVPWLYK